MCPFYAGFRRCPWSSGVILRVVSCFFSVRFAPVVPALRFDLVPQVAVDKNGFGIGSPGPAQVVRVGRRIAGNAAVQENKAIGCFLESRSRRDIIPAFLADDFSAENITFENSAGPVGQAVAVRVDGSFRRAGIGYPGFLENDSW